LEGEVTASPVVSSSSSAGAVGAAAGVGALVSSISSFMKSPHTFIMDGSAAPPIAPPTSTASPPPPPALLLPLLLTTPFPSHFIIAETASGDRLRTDDKLEMSERVPAPGSTIDDDELTAVVVDVEPSDRLRRGIFL